MSTMLMNPSPFPLFVSAIGKQLAPLEQIAISDATVAEQLLASGVLTDDFSKLEEEIKARAEESAKDGNVAEMADKIRAALAQQVAVWHDEHDAPVEHVAEPEEPVEAVEPPKEPAPLEMELPPVAVKGEPSENLATLPEAEVKEPEPVEVPAPAEHVAEEPADAPAPQAPAQAPAGASAQAPGQGPAQTPERSTQVQGSEAVEVDKASDDVEKR